MTESIEECKLTHMLRNAMAEPGVCGNQVKKSYTIYFNDDIHFSILTKSDIRDLLESRGFVDRLNDIQNTNRKLKQYVNKHITFTAPEGYYGWHEGLTPVYHWTNGNWHKRVMKPTP